MVNAKCQVLNATSHFVNSTPRREGMRQPALVLFCAIGVLRLVAAFPAQDDKSGNTLAQKKAGIRRWCRLGGNVICSLLFVERDGVRCHWSARLTNGEVVRTAPSIKSMLSPTVRLRLSSAGFRHPEFPGRGASASCRSYRQMHGDLEGRVTLARFVARLVSHPRTCH